MEEDGEYLENEVRRKAKNRKLKLNAWQNLKWKWKNKRRKYYFNQDERVYYILLIIIKWGFMGRWKRIRSWKKKNKKIVKTRIHGRRKKR